MNVTKKTTSSAPPDYTATATGTDLTALPLIIIRKTNAK